MGSSASTAAINTYSTVNNTTTQVRNDTEIGDVGLTGAHVIDAIDSVTSFGLVALDGFQETIRSLSDDQAAAIGQIATAVGARPPTVVSAPTSGGGMGESGRLLLMAGAGLVAALLLAKVLR